MRPLFPHGSLACVFDIDDNTLLLQSGMVVLHLQLVEEEV